MNIPPKCEPSVRLVATNPSVVNISTMPRTIKYILSPLFPLLNTKSPGRKTSNLSKDTQREMNSSLVLVKNGTVVNKDRAL